MRIVKRTDRKHTFLLAMVAPPKLRGTNANSYYDDGLKGQAAAFLANVVQIHSRTKIRCLLFCATMGHATCSVEIVFCPGGWPNAK